MKVIILIAFFYLSLFAATSQKVVLDDKEMTFIETHPEIIVGTDISKTPFAFFDDHGNIVGIDTDFIQRINGLTGLNIKQVPGSWGLLLEKLKNREVDAISTTVYSKEREAFAIFSESYATVSKYLFKRKDEKWSVDSVDSLKGKRIAVDKYSAADKKIMAMIGGALFFESEGMEEASKMLLEGRVDAMIASESFMWYMTKNFISNIELAYSFDQSRLNLIYSIRSDYPELLSIINKALHAIPENEKLQISAKWLKFERDKEPLFVIGADERGWLDSLPEIKLGMEQLKSEHKPYLYMDGDKLSGIAGEYLNLFFKEIGRSPKIVSDYYSTSRAAMIEGGKIDFSVLQFPPKEVIGDNVVQSSGHRSFPMAIFTRDDDEFISSLDDISSKRISACSVYAAKIIKQKYPNGDVKACDSPKEAIIELKSKKRDVLIGNLAVVSNYIREMGVDGLRVSAITPLEARIYLAAHPSMEPLVRMFDRFMESLPEEKHKEIYEKWVSVKLQKSVDYTLLYYIVLGFFVAIALIAFWNATLMREVGRRKKIEAALKESEAKFRTIFEYTNIGLAFGDASGYILDFNGAFMQMLGYEKEQLLGLNFADFTHKDDIERELLLIAELLRGEKSFYRMEKRYVTKDGDIIWADLMVSAIWGEGSKPDFFVGAVSDITDRKLLEGELEFLNEQLANQIDVEVSQRIKIENEKRLQEQMLIQNQKMAEMGEMIGVIAHQWKQPLNAIAIESQMLKEYFLYGELDEEGLKNFEKSIMKQVKFMTQTVDDFRNFFKPDREKIELSLNKEIEAVIRIISPVLMKYNVSVLFNAGDECFSRGYANEFKQVVLNIINNAKDAILENGISDGVVSLALFCKDGRSHIYIRDNGGGIPQHLLPDKIFESYMSTKGEKGTGIGLSMAKKIIEERMDGTLKAKNVDGGAEFEIELPY